MHLKISKYVILSAEILLKNEIEQIKIMKSLILDA